jgi:hypothetical protein
MRYRIARCTMRGKVLELDNELADTREKAMDWLRGLEMVQPNLWMALLPDGSADYAKIVEVDND